MTTGKRTFIGAALISSLAASLCCILPLLALFAGIGGAASALSWLEPLRPYLIGITVLILAFAWYQQLSKKPEDCCEDGKYSFVKGKKFLSIVTILAVLMIAFPYYGPVFSKSSKEKTSTGSTHLDTASFYITGMTCSGCEAHVINAVNELEGIGHVDVSYENEKAIILFDTAKTDQMEIRKAITKTGYKVMD